MSFTSKSLHTSNSLSFLKGATLFFLGMSCLLFVARAFEIVPIANNTVQYIKSIFLTSSGDNNSTVGIRLDGGSTGGITITNLTSAIVLGTDGSGKIVASTATGLYNFMSGVYSSGAIYNLISGYVLGTTGAQGPAGADGATGDTGPAGATGAAGMGGTLGGITGSIQFNDGGSLSGNNLFIYSGGNVGIGTGAGVGFNMYNNGSYKTFIIGNSFGMFYFGKTGGGIGGNGGLNFGIKNTLSSASSEIGIYNANNSPMLQLANNKTSQQSNYNTLWAYGGSLYIQTLTGTDNPNEGNVYIGVPRYQTAFRMFTGGDILMEKKVYIGGGDTPPYSEALTVGGNIKLDGTGIIYATSSSSNQIGLATNGYVGIGTATPSTKLYVAGDTTANAYYYISDKRLKTDITAIADPLAKILSLNGYMFTWKKDSKKDMGVIAQEVEKVFPEIVNTDAEGYKSVEYGNLVAPLIEAIKSLNAKVDEQAKEIKNLELRITN